jgi:hypothetical protein
MAGRDFSVILWVALKGHFMRDYLEIVSQVISIIGFPYGIWIYWTRQQKQLENDDAEAFQMLSDSYHDFLKVTLDNSDLHLHTNARLDNPTQDQQERMRIIFTMLIGLFERAWLIAHKPNMTKQEQKRWNSWHDYMQEWSDREDFKLMLPELLMGEDPEFKKYILQFLK